MFKLGFLVNPYAGIGGSVALKGSDGAEIREEALKRGAKLLAATKAKIALSQLNDKAKEQICLYVPSGPMGEDIARELGFDCKIIAHTNQPSESDDTRSAVQAMEQQGVDLILFAGGDGTARDVFAVLEQGIPVLGIPAGCKIHSGVYAVTPKAAGVLISQLVDGHLLSLREASVMDIDEQAFRQGVVKARNFGSMTVPDSLQFVQATKQGGREVESMVLDDIAADVVEYLEPDTYYAIGSGSTCAHIMAELGLDNTLLGVDVIKNGALVLQDVTAQQLLELSEKEPLEIFITLIGGQGHIIGRGNQQISADVIRSVGWERIHIIATKSKLTALEGRPLIVDSGDSDLDDALVGTKRVITGYHDSVIYRVGLDYES
ncbi:MAG: ATP-NAD kinase family protein [Gammaproteobacteria bacterium]|nr:ATP-NAD kinase family protein [Gammaproteobacteria bacterium]